MTKCTFRMRQTNTPSDIAASHSKPTRLPVHDPVNRRRFLSGLLAGAGSFALTACGGGGGSAVGNEVGNRVANATRKAAAPARGNTIPSAAQIVDSAGAAPAMTGAASGSAAVNPFYGLCGHICQGGAYATASISRQIDYLNQLGVKIYRNDTWTQGGATLLKTLAQAAAPSGIQLLAAMTPDWSTLSAEAQSYTVGYAQGQMTAKTLAGLVKYYECGNEYEIGIVSHDGVYANQYDNTRFQIFRGLIRGMIDGVKSVDAHNVVLPASGSWLHFGFFDMLWNGTQPDGSSGHPPVRWDVTAWHWYSDMGDITAANGASGAYNVLRELQKRYGQPIWITEYGVRPNFGSGTQAASYLVGNDMLGGFAANAAQYGVACTMMYELFDDSQAGGDGNYGLIQYDSVTKKPAFSALQSFISANPR